MNTEKPKDTKQKKVFPNMNKGVEVKPGTNWVTGLTHEQRQQELLKHEHKWKTRYNANRGTMTNFTRGG